MNSNPTIVRLEGRRLGYCSRARCRKKKDFLSKLTFVSESFCKIFIKRMPVLTVDTFRLLYFMSNHRHLSCVFCFLIAIGYETYKSLLYKQIWKKPLKEHFLIVFKKFNLQFFFFAFFPSFCWYFFRVCSGHSAWLMICHLLSCFLSIASSAWYWAHYDVPWINK